MHPIKASTYLFLQMFKPVRVVATIIFLGTIGLVFVGAFVIKIAVSNP